MTKDISLNEYITSIIALHDNEGKNKDKIEELRKLHGDTPTTYDDVEKAIQLMVNSIMQDVIVGERVQGAFNQSIIAILVEKDVISQKDADNVSDIMDNVHNQLYKELG